MFIGEKGVMKKWYFNNKNRVGQREFGHDNWVLTLNAVYLVKVTCSALVIVYEQILTE